MSEGQGALNMTTMNQVLADAMPLEKSYRAVLLLVAKVKEIGDLDKAYEVAELKLREHNQAVTTAENKMQAARDRLDVVNEEVDRAKEKASEIVAIAESDAKIMLANASQEVGLSNAKVKAEVQNAAAEVENFHKHVRVENEKHKARMAQNDTDYAEATERLAVLNTELTALQKKFGIA